MVVSRKAEAMIENDLRATMTIRRPDGTIVFMYTFSAMRLFSWSAPSPVETQEMGLFGFDYVPNVVKRPPND